MRSFYTAIVAIDYVPFCFPSPSDNKKFKRNPGSGEIASLVAELEIHFISIFFLASSALICLHYLLYFFQARRSKNESGGAEPYIPYIYSIYSSIDRTKKSLFSKKGL